MPAAPKIPVTYKEAIVMDSNPQYLTGLDLFLHRIFRNHSPEEIYQRRIDFTSYGEVVESKIRYHRRCRLCGRLSYVSLKA